MPCIFLQTIPWKFSADIIHHDGIHCLVSRRNIYSQVKIWSMYELLRLWSWFNCSVLNFIIISVLYFPLNYPNTRKPMHRDNSMATHAYFILLISHCPKVVLQCMQKRCCQGSDLPPKLYISLQRCSKLFMGDIHFSPLTVEGASAVAQTRQWVSPVMLSQHQVRCTSVWRTRIEQVGPPLTQTGEEENTEVKEGKTT